MDYGLYFKKYFFSNLFVYFSFYRLVSSLTEYSLESPHLTKHLTDDFFLNYFLSHLIQIGSFIVAFPMVYMYELIRLKYLQNNEEFCFV